MIALQGAAQAAQPGEERKQPVTVAKILRFSGRAAVYGQRLTRTLAWTPRASVPAWLAAGSVSSDLIFTSPSFKVQVTSLSVKWHNNGCQPQRAIASIKQVNIQRAL